jgi:hypothetical protein
LRRYAARPARRSNRRKWHLSIKLAALKISKGFAADLAAVH